MFTLGKLLKHGSISCADVSTNSDKYDKLKNFHLYVFEQMVLFCEETSKRNSFTHPVYVYKGHIHVSSSLSTFIRHFKKIQLNEQEQIYKRYFFCNSMFLYLEL